MLLRNIYFIFLIFYRTKNSEIMGL